ncbi:MAG: ArnT family glycosyltransferase [Crocinitomicaceae bacterium]
MILFLGTFSVLLFIQGILYPPNNWDSMTYHMARIAHWVMNESVYPYPTHIYRQIYQPPLAEWMIGQICILNRADYFANALQLMYLISSLACVNLIMQEFKLSQKIRSIAFILIFTTPSIFMQATSTQNDIVIGFFLLGTIYALIRFFKTFRNSNGILTGVFIGCALLTKGTAFVYLIPISLIAIIFLIRNIIKSTISVSKIAPSVSLLLLLILLIPSPHYYRNYALSGDIFGASDDHYFNQDSNVKSVALGLLKNMGNHLSTPFTSDITNQVVEKAHLITNIQINDEKYSYNGIHFKLGTWNHNEDEVSNFLQVILFLVTLLFLILQWKNTTNSFRFTTLFCLATFFIFSIILKWQPWHIRLQVPLFMMMAIPCSMMLYQIKFKKIIGLYLISATLYCMLLMMLNPNRPFIKTDKQAKLVTRFEKYFVAMPLFLPEFKKWRYRIKKNTPTKWGVHGDTWEYPMYYDCFDNKITPFKSVKIVNQTKELSSFKEN